ncbi:MAG: hypothetical protein AAF503_03060 [Pseudomonadota bacterium]
MATVERLARAIVLAPDPTPAPTVNFHSVIPWLSQFIEHDLLGIEPLEFPKRAGRKEIATALVNRRRGKLALDSLYGTDGPDQSIADSGASQLRHRCDPAQMRLGRTTLGLEPRPRLPIDRFADLPRIRGATNDQLTRLGANETRSTRSWLTMPIAQDAFPDPLQPALIGDRRNERNLFLAQLHVAILRFHNAVAAAEGPDTGNLWLKTRQLVRWHVQWLIANPYLQRICDPEILGVIRREEAPLFQGFLASNGQRDAARLPVPLEFAAAFQFNLATIRSSQDWVAAFPNLTLLPVGVDEDPCPLPSRAARPGKQLPGHLCADWQSLTATGDPLRSSAPIVPSLGALVRGGAGQALALRVARTLLADGLRLELPSAQACIAGIRARTGSDIKPLSTDQLCCGPAGAAIRDTTLIAQTPLWFYILQEAWCHTGGRRLGPLGSYLVASTLLGVIICDSNSFWHQFGPDQGRWSPDSGAMPKGEPITDLCALLRAADLL